MATTLGLDDGGQVQWPWMGSSDVRRWAASVAAHGQIQLSLDRLSLFLLVGIGANAAFGFWWADPLAALGMTFFIGREALEAWRGEDDD